MGSLSDKIVYTIIVILFVSGRDQIDLFVSLARQASGGRLS